MKNFFKTKYRVNRSRYFSALFWSVDKKLWFWPFWLEHRSLLANKEDALELKGILEGKE